MGLIPYYVQVLGDRTHSARKSYPCDVCGEPIEVGAKYRYQWLQVEEYGTFAWRTHVACHALADWVGRASECDHQCPEATPEGQRSGFADFAAYSKEWMGQALADTLEVCQQEDAPTAPGLQFAERAIRERLSTAKGDETSALRDTLALVLVAQEHTTP